MEFLAMLPTSSISVVFGLIAFLLSKIIIYKLGLKNKQHRTIIYIALFIFIIPISAYISIKFKQAVLAPKFIAQLKKEKLYALIFKLHPEAEKEFEQLFTEISGSSRDKIIDKLHTKTEPFMRKYLNEHFLLASNEAILKKFQHKLKVIENFRDKPEICVSYHLDSPDFLKKNIPIELLRKESDLIADLIESSITNPSKMTKIATPQQVTQVIAYSYQSNGYNWKELKELPNIQNLPPQEACRIAVNFNKALANMNPVQAGYVFKNIIKFQSNANKESSSDKI